MKYDEKNAKNVFTKKESNDIIKKDYNPLKVNDKIYERGSGLFKMKGGLLKEISKKMDWKGKVIIRMFPKTCIKIYGIASKNTTNNMLI